MGNERTLSQAGLLMGDHFWSLPVVGKISGSRNCLCQRPTSVSVAARWVILPFWKGQTLHATMNYLRYKIELDNTSEIRNSQRIRSFESKVTHHGEESSSFTMVYHTSIFVSLERSWNVINASRASSLIFALWLNIDCGYPLAKLEWKSDIALADKWPTFMIR